jgi:hypothetical protein
VPATPSVEPGLGRGKTGRGGEARLVQPRRRPLACAGLGQMIGELIHVVVEACRVPSLHRVGDPEVKALAAQEGKAPEQCLADLLMGEGESRLPAFLGDHQPRLLGRLERIQQLVFACVRYSLQEIEGEIASNAGSGGENGLGPVGDAVDATSQNEPYRLRHFDLADLDLRQPVAGSVHQTAFFCQVAIDLLDEKRHSLGLREDQLD